MNGNRRRWLLGSAAIAGLAAGAVAAWFAQRTEPDAPQALPATFIVALTFENAHGEAQPMAQWQGQWLVVNFWATWCAPCVEEMPALQQVARDYRNRGVAFVGLGIDNAAAIRRFQADLKIEIPLLVAGAEGSELARLLGNASGALPYTVLISPAGQIVRTRLGLVQPELLRTWLDSGLGG
jgi:thiol-disulfide isomerase/thioredoxin